MNSTYASYLRGLNHTSILFAGEQSDAIMGNNRSIATRVSDSIPNHITADRAD